MSTQIEKPHGEIGYNGTMIGRLGGAALAVLLICAGLSAQPAAGATPIDRIWQRLQSAFEARDLDAFAGLFAPEIREREKLAAATFSGQWKMDRVLFKTAGRVKDKAGRERVYAQVFYQNSFSAMLETWQVLPLEEDGAWILKEKEVTGSVSTLYRLHLPADRVERGARVEVRHADVRITFDDAWVYYDNVPDLETALVVLGEGRLRFEPSVAEEKHQLSLRFGASVFEDKIDSAFLRFSPSFFKDHITISGGSPPGPTEEAKRMANRAYALFSKDYPSSFTIENSLTDERLSFLPQGEQAVFDVRSRRAGDLTYIYSPASDEEVHLVSRASDQVINLYSPVAEGSSGRKMLVSFGAKTDVTGYQIDLDFQPEKAYLSARAKIDVAVRADSADSLKFNFSPHLDILKVYDQEGQELFYTQDRYRKLLYVYFLRPVERGRTVSIEVFYRGALEPPAQITDVAAGPQLNLSYSFLEPQFDTFLYSQSSLWYPAPTEEDFFPAKVRVIVPPGYSCVANGMAVEEGKVDGVQRVTSLDKVGNPYFGFETKKPVKYLSFIVGRFTRRSGGTAEAGSVPVEAVAATDVRFSWRGLADESRAVIKAYENWFGAFPFEKLTVVERCWMTAGGHSPASFVVLNELPRTAEGLLIPNPDSPVDLSRWKESYLAHEIAHQWWGQGVGGATYHDQWISEGLAQFAAARYLRAKLGEDVYLNVLKKFARWTEKKSKWGPITLGSRLSYLDFEAYQAIVYNKTALVLDMLAALLGEEPFFRGLKAFFASNTFRAARTGDFRAAMEKVSGRDLQPFFAMWFGSHLLPQVSASHSVRKDGERYILQLRVTQTGPAFVFPLRLSWEEDGNPVRRTIEIDAPFKEFEIPCAARPARVRFDPDRLLPGKLN